MSVLQGVKNVPQDLRESLLRDATERGLPVGANARRILCEFFCLRDQLPAPEHAWRPAKPSGDQLTFPVGRDLKQAIYAASLEWGVSQSASVLRILAQHYGVRYDAPSRGRA